MDIARRAAGIQPTADFMRQIVVEGDQTAGRNLARTGRHTERDTQLQP